LVKEIEYVEAVISPDGDSPDILTNHMVLDGNPVSMNLTLYITSENETAICKEIPLTVKEPEVMLETNILFAVDMV
jgi:hypothetical protein